MERRSQVERLRAITSDGVRLALRRFRAAGARRAVCLCTHAMMASGRYLHSNGGGFAAHLAARGVDVFVLDWRGHGDSVPPSPRRPPGWSFDTLVERDLPAAVEAVCEAAAIAPAELSYLGHSLGGLVGLAGFGTGAAPPPRRMSLWATNVWLEGRGGSLARRAVMAAYALSARPLGYAPIRRLRLGTDDEPAPYVAQLWRWVKSGEWRSLRGADYLASLSSLAAPAWFVVGDGDRLCRPADARALASRLPGALPLRQVGIRHGDPFDPDHFALFSRRLVPLWDEAAAYFVGTGLGSPEI